MRKICAIYFLVNNPSKTACTVERVDCSPFTQQTWRKAKLMMASQTGEMNSIQIFTISVEQSYAFPTRISRFRVKMSSTTPMFDFKFRDQSFKEELWGSARNLKLTDFVFLVGFTSFPAHRSLLAARNPDFCCYAQQWTGRSPNWPSPDQRCRSRYVRSFLAVSLCRQIGRERRRGCYLRPHKKEAALI